MGNNFLEVEILGGPQIFGVRQIWGSEIVWGQNIAGSTFVGVQIILVVNKFGGSNIFRDKNL